jgi:hypothetical protein
MSESSGQSARRGLALAGAVLGALLLFWAGVDQVRAILSERAPGSTAGGAVTVRERCSRGVPADLAQACIAQAETTAATAAQKRWLAAALGVGLILFSARVRQRRRGAAHPREV